MSASWNALDGVNYEDLIGFRFELANLICGRFRTDFTQFVMGEQACSPISGRVAMSMIRVAATRIFANPAQSIMEVPVNSIDSYRRLRYGSSAPSVGKFGMGFYSFLYWLVGHPERTLTLKSTYQSQFWHLVISEVDGQLMAEFQPVDSFEASGLSVILDASQDPLTRDIVDGMNDYLGRLVLINDVTLTTEAEDVKADVHIKVTLNQIYNYDQAEGVSLTTLFTSLLIPSISTKTIAAATRDPNFVNASRITLLSRDLNLENVTLPRSKYEGLVITVGDVIIVTGVKTLVSQLLTDRNSYIITLPLDAPLPVSRDDVLLFPGTPSYKLFYRSMKRIIDQAILEGHNLELFFGWLREYGRVYDKQVMGKLIEKGRNYVLNNPDLIILPSLTVTRLLRKTSTRFVYLSNCHLVESNRRLKLTLDARYTLGDITIVPLAHLKAPNDANMPSFIFVPESLMVHDDWNARLALTWERAVLSDTGLVVPDQLYDLLVTAFTAIPILTPWMGIVLPKLEPWLRHELNALYAVIIAKFATFGSKTMKHISPPQSIVELGNQLALNKDVTLAMTVFLYALHVISVFAMYADDDADVQEFILQLRSVFSFFKLKQRAAGWTSVMVRPIYYDINLFRGLLYPERGNRREEEFRMVGNTSATDLKFITLRAQTDNIDFVLPPDTVKSRALVREGFHRLLYLNLAPDSKELNDGSIFYMSDTRHYPQFTLAYVAREFEPHLRSMVADHLNYVINEADTGFEASIVLSVVGHFVLKFTNYKAEPGLLIHPETLTFIMLEQRQRFGVGFLDEWSRLRPGADQNGYLERYQALFYQPMIYALEIYLDAVRDNLLESDRVKVSSPQNPIIFRGTQLIDFVFYSGRTNPTTRDELLDFIRAAGQHQKYRASDRPRFQSIEIAVNEGTSKPFVASVLTELIQNSIDAMRGAGITESIDIELNHDYLTVRDYVGIPDRALLALWIPFLSSKDVGELMSTGEMGTGFFNVYRQPYTKCIYITTNNLQIKAKPLVMSGRVVDIEYQVRPQDHSMNFTEIRIVFNPMPLASLVTLKVDAGLFIYSMLAYVNYNVNYNGVSIKASSELVYTSSVLTVRKMMFVKTPSILMSHGVPLSLLMPYLVGLYGRVDNHDLNTGIIVDIDKRFYRPVQSRTRIITTSDDQVKRELEYGLHAYVTSRLLEPDARPLYMEGYVPFLASNTQLNNCTYYFDHISAAKVLIRDQKYVGLRPDPNTEMIASIINDIQGHFVQNYGVTINAETIDAKFKQSNRRNPLTDVSSDIRQLILLWFKTKLPYQKPGTSELSLAPVPVSLRMEEISVQMVTDHSAVRIMNKFVAAFSMLISELDFKLQVYTPEVILSPSGDARIDYHSRRRDVLGGEYENDMVIVVNGVFYLKKLDLLTREWARFVSEYRTDKMAAAAYLRIGCDALKLFMGNTRPGPSILIRHLVKILIDMSKLKDVNGVYKITFQNEEHQLNFDDLCHFIYTQVTMKGLWDVVV